MSSTIRAIFFILAALTFVGGAAHSQQQSREFPDIEEASDVERWNWFYNQRTYPADRMPDGATIRALEQSEQSTRLSASAPIAGAQWVNIGPAPVLGGQIEGVTVNPRVSGRVSDVAIDPADLSHWLIATAGGGIWETRDAGATWSSKTDNEATLVAWTVDMAPSNPNIIYAGAGTSSALGNGILKSTDSGNTWQLLGATTFSNSEFFSIRDTAVHPTDPDTVLAVSNLFFGPTPSSGVFKSTDGGRTWSKKLPGNGAELEVDPVNFNNQYAGIRTTYPDFDSSLNGVYRSDDAGDNWQRINGPWGAVQNNFFIEIAVAPSNHNMLYVLMSNGGNQIRMWRTDNAWASTPAWVELPSNPAFDPNIGVVTAIVDPVNSDIVYAGGFPDMWKFVGGVWRKTTSSTHVDQIAMAWAGNRLILGNDGGVWSSDNGGSAWTNYNSNLSITQFYLGSLHPTDANFALGGSQDNGTEKWTGTQTWQFHFGGDGADNAISSSNPNAHWAVSYQYLGLLRTTDGGNSFFAAGSGIVEPCPPCPAFIARFEKCPSNDDIFIAGGRRLWRSSNFFSSASPSWFSNSPEMDSPITAAAFAQQGCSTYAFGTASGQLRLTTDGGNTWVDIDPMNSVPNRTVTDLAFDQKDSNHLYITLSGFDQNTPGKPGHVFKTTSALSPSPSWINISPPVNIPHNAVAVSHNSSIFGLSFFLPVDIVYVGTDLGVWISFSGGSEWQRWGIESGMPNIFVLDIQVNDSTGRAVAYTYGRGAFEICTWAINPQSASFESEGGTGSVMIADYAVCGWVAASNAEWITITSGVSGNGNGTINYSVAPNVGSVSRNGTITVANQVLTITQLGAGVRRPEITGASVSGKHLLVTGRNFDSGAVILMNGVRQKTLRDSANPDLLKGKKTAKKIARGQTVTLQVQNSDGTLSSEFLFTR
jgi:hypothetical protein